MPNTVKYFFLLFEKTDSHLGAEVILDTHKITTLQIRRVTSDNELLCDTNKITNFPSLIVLGRNETQKSLKIRVPTREGAYSAIRGYMISKGEKIDEQSPKSHFLETEDHKSSTSSSKHSQDAERPEGTAEIGRAHV